MVSSPLERISSGESIKMRGFHMEWKEAPGYPSFRTCKRIPLAGPCSFLAHPSISSTVGILSPAPIPKSHFHPHPAAWEVQTLPRSRSPPGLPCPSCLPSTLSPLDCFHFFPNISIVQQIRDAPLSQSPSVCRRERIYLHQHPIIRGNL